MLKPFYNKKKNIDNRLVPPVTAADAGKVLGVTEEGKIAPVEGGSSSIPTAYLSEAEELVINSEIIPFFQNADDTLKRGNVNISTIGASLYEKLIPFASSSYYRGILFATRIIFQLYCLEDDPAHSLLGSEPIHFNNSTLNIDVLFHLNIHLDKATQTASITVFFQKVNKEL